jgi:hypothetical protein
MGRRQRLHLRLLCVGSADTRGRLHSPAAPPLQSATAERLYAAAADVFAELPLCCVIPRVAFVVHAGALQRLSAACACRRTVPCLPPHCAVPSRAETSRVRRSRAEAPRRGVASRCSGASMAQACPRPAPTPSTTSAGLRAARCAGRRAAMPRALWKQARSANAVYL